MARSDATATSLSIAIIIPPPWQMPLTAHTIGLGDRRTASNGHDVHAEQVEHAPVVGAAPAELAAGDEHVAGAGDEQAGQVGIAVHVVDGVADAEVHRRRERVARLGSVDDDVGEHPVALEAEELATEPVALGRARGVTHDGHRRLKVASTRSWSSSTEKRSSGSGSSDTTAGSSAWNAPIRPENSRASASGSPEPERAVGLAAPEQLGLEVHGLLVVGLDHRVHVAVGVPEVEATEVRVLAEPAHLEVDQAVEPLERACRARRRAPPAARA